jgi:chitin synthase
MTVFEYYISHHMTKAFESMFGGVTCLPGCFSMYRIKAPKVENGYWVPVLANPDIVEHYSENIVDTLHKKNLLLLGEDRYLTTLMLKTFPKRKMVFCPQAVCKTIVPDRFGVLLSQRRRWINSTIHNLAELLLVRDLCGTFCFSMQFVVFMELAGTLVLPAAISFTVFLIVISAVQGASQNVIPLVLLGIILGLPGLLIVVTSRKIAYIGWMLIYLLSLPIWNFILPAYAFWHFDDFSWGQTRKIAGDKGGNHGDKEGEFDSSHIVMKRWAEFEKERRWKLGHSRDSSYLDPYRSISPRRCVASLLVYRLVLIILLR